MQLTSGVSLYRDPLAQSAGAGDGAQTMAAQREAQLEARRKESYDHIYNHEMAHHMAAGQFSGGININYDANGIATSGFVPIHIPGLNRDNPSESMAAYQQIKAAALAPSDPSGADLGVAAKADALMFSAQAAQAKMDAKPQQSGDTGSRLNVMA
jgi:hypothetical protein